MTPRVREILDWYKSENIGVRSQLARLLGAGALAGSGKMAFLTQSYEFSKGPELIHGVNRNSYDPNYHMELCIDLGLTAYSASSGLLEAALPDFPGELLTALELNQISAKGELIELAKPKKALALGSTAVKINLPMTNLDDHFTWLQNTVESSKELGLPSIVSAVSPELSVDEASFMDLVTNFCQKVSVSGAHIINVYFPENKFSHKKNEKMFLNHRIKVQKAFDRVKHVLDCSFNGKKIVLFSLNESLNAEELILQGKEIARGGGFGTMINSDLLFKYSKEDAKKWNTELLTQFKR